jgi:hypothetical protein
LCAEQQLEEKMKVFPLIMINKKYDRLAISFLQLSESEDKEMLNASLQNDVEGSLRSE